MSSFAHYRSALFYYILGGLTFIPLCILLLFVYFALTAPPHRPPQPSSLPHSLADTESEFTEDRKRQAIELAVWNQEAQKQVHNAENKEDAQGSSTAPAAAKRLGPTPAPPRRPHRAGWLIVRRHFLSDTITQSLQNAAALASANAGSEKAANNPSKDQQSVSQTSDEQNTAGGPGYMSTLYRGMLNYRNKAADGARGRAAAGNKSPASGTQTPEHAQETHKEVSPTNGTAGKTNATNVSADGKEAYYCILKGPVLFLYSSADANHPSTECHAAIDLRNKRVSIFVAGEGDTIGEPEDDQRSHSGIDTSDTESVHEGDVESRRIKRAIVRDGELFVKRNAIRIVSLGTETTTGTTRYAQWFVFAKSATTFEDWYHALVHASLLPSTTGDDPIWDPIGPVFSTDDMTGLLGSLDNIPDPIPLRWLNAMVGRIFFSIYRTAWLENYIKRKITKKITRVRTPSFLSNIQVREVDMGRSPPAFSRPMLKSLTGDGEASMEVAVHYRGELRLTISTVLTISLGARFKQYNVSLVLAVVLHSLEGNLLLHIKPPPSNRLWFGFTKLPKMEIGIEPVVSERKVQWSMVKRLIEGRIRELLTESLVVPNMDDISFFDTRPFERRGGIWADAAKEHTHTPQPPLNVDETKSTPSSVLNVPVDTEDAQESPSASSLNLPAADNTVRHRKSGHTSPIPPSPSSTLSPAAAGLSTLLAKDKAMAPDGQEPRTAAKRRSWFAGSGRPPGKSMADQMAKRKGVPQSSLAWGSASLDPQASTNNDDPVQSNSVSLPPDSNTPESVSSQQHSDISFGDASIHDNDDNSSNEDPDIDANATIVPHVTTEEVDGPEKDPSTELPPLHASATVSPVAIKPQLPKRSSTSQTVVPPPQRTTHATRVNPAQYSLHAQNGPRQSSNSSVSSGAHSLASIQRERYGAPEGDGSERPAGSAALLQTWNKAKASMADRESRQAAAKEAKDALKRGWANWNTRRTGASNNDADSLLTSSDRLGESSADGTSIGRAPRSRTNSWLASSPEDPASLGVGFDVHDKPLISSPSVLSLDNADDHTEDTISNRSRDSSVSGRKPYREHLADKKSAADSDVHRPTSSASSVQSFEAIDPSTTHTDPLSHSVVDAPASMSVAPPTSIKSEQARSSFSSSPSTVRPTSSGEAGHDQHAMYSFVPGQPSATVGLSPGTDAGTMPTSVTPPRKDHNAALEIDYSDRREQTSSQSATDAQNAHGKAEHTPPQPSKGIKQQPTRATMMAVPGIPSMQKQEPQSFEAPTEKHETPPKRVSSGGSPRIGIGGLIPRIPFSGSLSSQEQVVASSTMLSPDLAVQQKAPPPPPRPSKDLFSSNARQSKAPESHSDKAANNAIASAEATRSDKASRPEGTNVEMWSHAIAQDRLPAPSEDLAKGEPPTNSLQVGAHLGDEARTSPPLDDAEQPVPSLDADKAGAPIDADEAGAPVDEDEHRDSQPDGQQRSLPASDEQQTNPAIHLDAAKHDATALEDHTSLLSSQETQRDDSVQSVSSDPKHDSTTTETQSHDELPSQNSQPETPILESPSGDEPTNVH